MSRRKTPEQAQREARVARQVKRLERQPFNTVPPSRRGDRTRIPIKMASSPAGGIPARSGSTPGSATCVFEDHTTSTSATGASYTVYNFYTTAIGASKKIYVGWVDGHWEVMTEQC